MVWAGVLQERKTHETESYEKTPNCIINQHYGVSMSSRSSCVETLVSSGVVMGARNYLGVFGSWNQGPHGWSNAFLQGMSKTPWEFGFLFSVFRHFTCSFAFCHELKQHEATTRSQANASTMPLDFQHSRPVSQYKLLFCINYSNSGIML
jgi:hypothetical protein